MPARSVATLVYNESDSCLNCFEQDERPTIAPWKDACWRDAHTSPIAIKWVERLQYCNAFAWELCPMHAAWCNGNEPTRCYRHRCSNRLTKLARGGSDRFILVTLQVFEQRCGFQCGVALHDGWHVQAGPPTGMVRELIQLFGGLRCYRVSFDESVCAFPDGIRDDMLSP